MGNISTSFVYDLANDKQPASSSDQTSINIGVFIDGTATNAHNTEARDAYKQKYSNDKSKAYKKYHGGEDSSYENDYSNVYKLYDSYIFNNSYKQRIYIEGIGTVYKEKESIEFDRYGKDDFSDGVGFGKGINGIRGKVFKACEQAVDLCPKTVTNITFDVFGFSRGAAAARNFIYEIFRPDGIPYMKVLMNNGRDNALTVEYVYTDNIDLKNYTDVNKKFQSNIAEKNGFIGFLFKLKDIDINKININVRFVGIFDTVASYDPYNLFPNFKKGVDYLHLNDSLNKAKMVVHLTSQNEHRENFSLTPIASSISQKREYCLPGVHSDIGGSYVDGAKEEKIVAKDLLGIESLKKRKEWLVEQRFFRDKDLIIDEKSFFQKSINSSLASMLYKTINGQELDISNYLRSYRLHVASRYDRIPLKIMIDYGNKYDLFDNNIADSYTLIKFNKGSNNFVEKMKVEIKEKLSLITFSYKVGLHKGGINSTMNLLFLQLQIDNLISEMSDSVKVEKESIDPDEDLLFYTRQVIESAIKENKKVIDSIFTFKTASTIIQTKKFQKCLESYNNNSPFFVNTPFPEEEILQQIVLRILRYRCFHWSATYSGLVEPHSPINNNPTSNGSRHIYNA